MKLGANAVKVCCAAQLVILPLDDTSGKRRGGMLRRTACNPTAR